ncbi:MAG: DUF3492 domain-containing protein [Epsilonproteobacteria bacterium]|nr:DUF3492 domain-containing protein [Campylobacterota bacterium]
MAKREKYLRRADQVDVMILAEGTYPFVKGGVSSWIHQLVTGLPHKRFGICFIGSRPEDYGEVRYELPENLVHVEVHYLFEEQKDPPPRKLRVGEEAMKSLEKLHQAFRDQQDELPETMRSIDFFKKALTFDHFLHSKEVWEFVRQRYYERAGEMPFIEYFWSIRNMHRPIWVITDIVAAFPEVGLFHAPSTGYGGMIGTLGSYHSGAPFLLTEHGIYTRERKIDLLTAEWISYHKLSLLSQAEEMNYIKELWIRFFERIARMAYRRANEIFSLYRGARNVQIAFGAPEEKTRVIPNGVDVEGLGKLVDKREKTVPKVITLIGRVVSIKDIKTFIRAMRIAADAVPGIEGWIVGPDDEDPEYAAECRQMVEALRLEDCVKFLGFQKIHDILPKTGLLTLTSISEGMPLVILEGFAAGVPCVATDVGSCRDLIYGGIDEEDEALGAAGAVTGIASPSDLATEYIRFLRDDKLWEEAQETGLKRVRRYYRQDQFLKDYDAVYDRYLEGGDGRDRV